MHKRSVTLQELPTGGWLWLEHDRRYKSAVTAYRAIKSEDRKRAGEHGAAATVITWQPCSSAGSAAVRSLEA